MIVLDTDIVTHISFGKNEKLLKRIELVPEDEELAVTVITYMEILQGRFDSIKKAANENELVVAMQHYAASKELVDSFQVLEINGGAAQHFKEMIKRKKGPKMRRGDMLNACIALANNALLVTRNVKDYEAVKGLSVENWMD
jgi:predicted nucleic acid-binding protein